MAGVIGLPHHHVRAISKLVGGGFGGKADLSVQHHDALLAWHTKRPVKVTLSRKDSPLFHPKRHAMEIEGAVAMGLGYALTEDFPLRAGVPTVKFGTLGLFRSLTCRILMS